MIPICPAPTPMITCNGKTFSNDYVTQLFYFMLQMAGCMELFIEATDTTRDPFNVM